MINVTTMIMQLIVGKPNGVRICRIEGESLVTVVVPRNSLSETKQLPELPYRGVYYLLDENHGVLSSVYAGQTTQGLARLDAHKAKKEFWNKAVMFLDDDNNIDRDVLDALESKTIEYVRTHGSYETDNAVAPKPRLNPYKEQRVEHLHASILFRMKTLGYDLDRVDKGPAADTVVLHTRKNGIEARGRYNKDTGSFTVLAGSSIALEREILKNRYALDLRKQLFGADTTQTQLEHDVELSSPSAAAVFVLGGSQNGWTKWVDDTGK